MVQRAVGRDRDNSNRSPRDPASAHAVSGPWTLWRVHNVSGAQVEVEETYRLAVLALDSGDLRTASELFLSVLADDAESAGALRGLAMCQEKVGRLDKAAETFGRAVSLRSCPPSVLVEAGEFYKRTGAHSLAEVTLRRAVAQVPDPSWLQRLGSLLIATGNQSEGLDWMRRGLALSPNDAQLRVNLVQALLRAAVAPEAARILNEGLVLSANNPLLIGMAGLICAERKDWVAAVEFSSQALRLDPSICWIRSGRAQAFRQLDQNESARRDYEKVIEECPEDVEAMRALGEVLETLGAFADAVELLERAHRLSPTDSELVAQTSYSMVQLGRADEGIERARRGVSVGDPISHRRLARVLGAADRLDEALEVCKYAWSLDPTSPDTLFLEGQLMAAKGLRDAAAAAFDQADALDPEPFLRNPNLRPRL